LSRVKVNITMSLDGFVAGPSQSEKDPLGTGGEHLHEWLLPLRAFREGHGEEGGEVNASTPIAEEILGNVGATIMGRGIESALDQARAAAGNRTSRSAAARTSSRSLSRPACSTRC
jgi:hypothetical protein